MKEVKQNRKPARMTCKKNNKGMVEQMTREERNIIPINRYPEWIY